MGDPYIKSGRDEDGGEMGGITLRETTIVDPRQTCLPFLSYMPVCTASTCASLLDVHGDVEVVGNPADCCTTGSGPSIPKNVTQTNVSLTFSCATAKTDDLEPQTISANKKEVRWYTAVGSVGQFKDEESAATGLFSCCTGFRLYENSSFGCPSANEFAKSTAPHLAHGLTVDHVIGGHVATHVHWSWAKASAGIPAMVRCAELGNITGFLIGMCAVRINQFCTMMY
jgi:hypothetical protein